MAQTTWRRRLGRVWNRVFNIDTQESTDSNSFTLGEAPSSGTAVSTGGGGNRDPKQSIIKKIGLALTDGGGGGGKEFTPPEYDFQEITDAYNTEGYIRQAIDKYIEMMFKSDWEFVGQNPNAVEYVNMRFKLMAEATQIPTNQLFIEVAEDLVKYSNVIIAKARAKDNLPFQGLNVTGVGENLPVAGYFPINVATIKVMRDKFGVVKRWQQEVDGGDKPVAFKPDDIIHIYYKREKGRAFGTPFLVPALDDLRSLRQVEENVLRLVYRNLHPLWHVKVGLEQEGLGAQDGEVDDVRNEIDNMDIEGALITTERVNISPIASNQIIDAKEYLKYFEQRAFTVLGVSELMMGRGNTANRSTGDNLSGEFIDRVKAMQRVMMTFINEFMLKEIMMEGGFDPIMNPDDAVKFQFNEIDMDSKIKAENQAVFLYEHNAISEDEMRELIGRDIIEDGDVRSKMHLQIVTIAQMETEAALTPAPAQGSGGSTGSTAKKKPSTKSTDNKTKPANQHGVKSSPKKATNSLTDEMFNEYNLLHEATRSIIENHYGEPEYRTEEILGGTFVRTRDTLMTALDKHVEKEVAEQLRVPVERMLESIHSDVRKTIKDFDSINECQETIHSVFSVYMDRLDTIGNKANELYQLKEVDSIG